MKTPARKTRYKAPGTKTLVLREDPPESAASGQPEARPEILVLEEHDEPLYAAAQALTLAGYTPRMISDEDLAATRILGSANTHFLLLTAHRSSQPLSVPQLIERLRSRFYDRTIRYCAKADLLPTTRAAYEALSVDQVLVLPAKARCSALDALAWLAGQTALAHGGLTILET